MDRHVLLWLLLNIALLLSFAFCTPTTRLQWNSSRSASRYNKTPIGQPAHSSNVTRSLYDIIPFEQTPSPSLSQMINTSMTFGQLPSSTPTVFQATNVTYAPHKPSSSPSPSASSSFHFSSNETIIITIGQPVSRSFSPPSVSASFNQSSNITFEQPASSSPPPNLYTSFAQSSPRTAADITPSAGGSRGGLNLFGIIGTAIAVIVVSLVILIAVINAFKKKRATQNDVGDSLVEVTDIRSYTTGQQANRGGNALEVGIMEICTHTVEELNLNSMEMGTDRRAYSRTGQLANPSGNALEVGIMEIRTQTEEELNSMEVGTDRRAYATPGQLANPSGNALEVGIMEIRTHTVEENSKKEGIDVRTYAMEELAKATNNFADDTIVGKGVSGFVHRANLPGDSRMGAVKRAKDLDPILFKQELSVLLRLPRHPHLVDLIGLCLQPGEPILIFEFISNGNLHDRLHKNNKGVTSPLSWTARMDIAYQVALALQYLHEEAKPPILHRDVKSANVLLVNDNSAKLADFGLSKLGPKNNQFTVTAVRGSYGCMDPQYVKTGRYSAKSDVYSFGVLLLELITGLKALHESMPLAEWTAAYRFSEGIERFMTIVDPNMNIDGINTMELQNMIKIANLCVRDITEERSSMTEIVNMMQEARNINGNVNLADGGEVPLLGNGNFA